MLVNETKMEEWKMLSFFALLSNYNYFSVQKDDDPTFFATGIDKVQKIAKYFNVTTDYLLGITNIPTPADELLGDNDIVTLQRAKSKMSPVDRERMMQMLKIAFDYAFRDDQ